MSTIIDYNELGTPSEAWIGYDQAALRRGELVIRICGECEGIRVAESMAAKLKCRTFRTLCQKHIAERTARLTGETL